MRGRNLERLWEEGETKGGKLTISVNKSMKDATTGERVPIGIFLTKKG